MRIWKALLVASVLVLPIPALAQSVAQPAPALITVSGEGRFDGAPDMAVLSLGVTTQGDTARAAMTANSEAMTAVTARLTAAGIEARDMQTSGLAINPVWSKGGFSSGGGGRIESYVVSNQLTIRVRALDRVGGVLDAVVTDGANTLNGLSFSISDPAPGLEVARKAAAADARAKAELLTAALGVRLGRVVSISESGGYFPPGPVFAESMSRSADVPVQGGEVSIGANVTVVFEIEQ